MAGRDVVVAAAVLGLGALAAWQSARLPFGGIHSPGPGFFPWWASLLIAALGALLLARALMAQTGAARTEPAAAGHDARDGVMKVARLLAVLVLYVALLEPLGYPLCTFVLVVFMLRVLEPQRWAVAVGMAGVTAIASYVLFAVWLKVPLPPGPFGR